MDASRRLTILVLCFLLLGTERAGADPGPSRPTARPAEIRVETAHDGQPFAYDMQLLRDAPSFHVYRLRYPSPVVTPVEANNTVPADYYLPRGADEDGLRRPAVICLHILHGNFELERLTCSVLAARGIPSMMIKLPYYGERAPPEGTKVLTKNPALFLQALSQGFADVRRAVDLLASRREVNAQAIGVIGVSLGGIVGATASAQEPRIARAALILAGGDLGYIVEHAPETRGLKGLLANLSPAEQKIARQAIHDVDPLTHAPQLRDRAQQGRVLMVNAVEDVTIAPQCARKLAEALGMPERVVWLPGLGHYTAIAALPQVLEHAVAFFGQDLPAAAQKPPAAPANEPLQVLAELLRQVSALAAAEPASGRGHFVALEVALRPAQGKPVEVQFSLARGSGARFRLEGQFPEIGQVAVGQGSYPWIMAQGKRVFRGVGGTDTKSRGVLDAIPGGQRLRLQIIRGALDAIVRAPETLTHLADVRAETEQGRLQAIVIAPRDGSLGQIRLALQADRTLPGPSTISFEARQASGQIVVRQWQIDTVAPDELFCEPPGLECQDVDRADLERMFSAVLKFALEQLP